MAAPAARIEKRLNLTIEAGKKTSEAAGEAGEGAFGSKSAEMSKDDAWINGVPVWLLGGFSTLKSARKVQRFLDLYGRN
jgi:hypothetical protein